MKPQFAESLCTLPQFTSAPIPAQYPFHKNNPTVTAAITTVPRIRFLEVKERAVYIRQQPSVEPRHGDRCFCSRTGEIVAPCLLPHTPPVFGSHHSWLALFALGISPLCLWCLNSQQSCLCRADLLLITQAIACGLHCSTHSKGPLGGFHVAASLLPASTVKQHQFPWVVKVRKQMPPPVYLAQASLFPSVDIGGGELGWRCPAHCKCLAALLICPHWCWLQPHLPVIKNTFQTLGWEFLGIALQTHCLTERNLSHTVPEVTSLKMTSKIEDHSTKLLLGVL